ncbi:flagellar hook-associated protein FlgK [Candidatus Poribacteria bacterium]|nr:flagellar hook-associated protein FlgK [Candidatus Poribacteria bacterium]
MSNLLGSLEIGKRALNVQRMGITIAGHNLANVNTPDFARQRPEITGAEVTQIRQIRDKFLEARFRQLTQDSAGSDVESERLRQLEVLFGDLSDTGITSVLSEFWDAFSDLTTQPESHAARITAIENGETLAAELKGLYLDFRQMHTDLDTEIQDEVTQVNQIAESIARLNREIIAIEGTGVNANDQRDRRAQHLTELSEIINFSVTEEDNGSTRLTIGGFALVDGVNVSELKKDTVSTASLGVTSSIGDASTTTILSEGGLPISITRGKLAGLINVRDNRIPEMVERLDLLTNTLMDEVNDLHRSGYGLDGTTQIPFFSGSSIKDISVNPLLQTHSEKLAVAGTIDAEGDNQIALAIAQKRHEKLFSDGTETFEEFNNSTIGIIGVYTQKARRQAENNELLLQQTQAIRESVSGVSIDEELSNLILFQRAYESAARYISIVDGLLETLINM